MVNIYGISQCNTVKKALSWLEDEQLPTHFHDFKRSGVPVQELERWLEAFGWERLVNRSGTTWRRLGVEERSQIVDAKSAAIALVQKPSLIKRPVVVWEDEKMTLGFKIDVFAAHRTKP